MFGPMLLVNLKKGFFFQGANQAWEQRGRWVEGVRKMKRPSRKGVT